MKVWWVAVLVILVMASVVGAAEDPVLTTQKDKESYVVGLLVAEDLKGQGMELNPDWLVRGITDGITGNKPLLTEQEAVETMNVFRASLSAKREGAVRRVAEKNKKQSDEFLAENQKKEGVKTLPSGLQYKVIKEGAGPTPTADDSVTVHYRGAFIDDNEFDNSHKRGEPAVLPVGGVISGWTEALQLMKVGSQWQIFVPPELAYREAGAGGVIPPNAVLIFDVELISIVKEEKAAEKQTGEEKPEKEKADEEKAKEGK